MINIGKLHAFTMRQVQCIIAVKSCIVWRRVNFNEDFFNIWFLTENQLKENIYNITREAMSPVNKREGNQTHSKQQNLHQSKTQLGHDHLDWNTDFPPHQLGWLKLSLN